MILRTFHPPGECGVPHHHRREKAGIRSQERHSRDKIPRETPRDYLVYERKKERGYQKKPPVSQSWNINGTNNTTATSASIL